MEALVEDLFPKCMVQKCVSIFGKGPTRLFPKKPLSQKQRFGDETLYFEIQSLFSKIFFGTNCALYKKSFWF